VLTFPDPIETGAHPGILKVLLCDLFEQLLTSLAYFEGILKGTKGGGELRGLTPVGEAFSSGTLVPAALGISLVTGHEI